MFFARSKGFVTIRFSSSTYPPDILYPIRCFNIRYSIGLGLTWSKFNEENKKNNKKIFVCKALRNIESKQKSLNDVVGGGKNKKKLGKNRDMIEDSRLKELGSGSGFGFDRGLGKENVEIDQECARKNGRNEVGDEMVDMDGIGEREGEDCLRSVVISKSGYLDCAGGNSEIGDKDCVLRERT